MKPSIIFSILCALVLFSCKEDTSATEGSQEQKIAATSYIAAGEKISPEYAIAAEEMKKEYSNLKPGDSLQVKFTAQVGEVCQKKGCWMKLQLPGEEQVMVKFREYSFFVPKDIEGEEVIVEGKAFISLASVEQQRHFAEDAGKTPEEIAAITTQKKTLSFIADGVLIKN